MSLKKITREGYAFFLIISKRIYTQYDTPPAPDNILTYGLYLYIINT